MAERPFASRGNEAGTSPFERGTGTEPFLLAQAPSTRQSPDQRARLEEFSPDKLKALSLEQRRARYAKLLSGFEEVLFASARKHVLPSQLLATVILNELNDISAFDVVGETTGTGSVGIAQIQSRTALEFGLVDIDPALAVQRGNPFLPSKIGSESSIAADLLRIPRHAIEAAARYIRILIQRMTENRERPWQKKHVFVLARLEDLKDGQDLYKFMGFGTQPVREQLAANMVAAAYNSPEIIIARLEGSFTDGDPAFRYVDAVPHGENAALVAKEIGEPPALFRG